MPLGLEEGDPDRQQRFQQEVRQHPASQAQADLAEQRRGVFAEILAAPVVLEQPSQRLQSTGQDQQRQARQEDAAEGLPERHVPRHNAEVAGDTGGGESETEAVLAGEVGEDPARGVEQQHAGDQQQGQSSHQAAVAGQAVACHRGYSWEGGQAPRKRGKPE